MHSPSAEWTFAIGHLAVLDYLRSRGDADGDTISECLRDAVARTPHGELLLTGALVLGGLAFRRHIVRPLHT